MLEFNPRLCSIYCFVLDICIVCTRVRTEIILRVTSVKNCTNTTRNRKMLFVLINKQMHSGITIRVSRVSQNVTKTLLPPDENLINRKTISLWVVRGWGGMWWPEENNFPSTFTATRHAFSPPPSPSPWSSDGGAPRSAQGTISTRAGDRCRDPRSDDHNSYDCPIKMGTWRGELPISTLIHRYHTLSVREWPRKGNTIVSTSLIEKYLSELYLGVILNTLLIYRRFWAILCHDGDSHRKLFHESYNKTILECDTHDVILFYFTCHENGVKWSWRRWREKIPRIVTYNGLEIISTSSNNLVIWGPCISSRYFIPLVFLYPILLSILLYFFPCHPLPSLILLFSLFSYFPPSFIAHNIIFFSLTFCYGGCCLACFDQLPVGGSPLGRFWSHEMRGTGTWFCDKLQCRVCWQYNFENVKFPLKLY